MKIVFFETPSEEQDKLKELLTGHELSFYAEKLTEDNVSLAKDAEVLSVFINSVVGSKIIDSIPNLKFITTRSTGYDHIDLVYARNKGVVVSNVPAYGSYTVAEFTFALLLNLSRKVASAQNKLKEEGVFAISGFEGFDLHGKVLGVVGTGKIGKNVIKIAKGFGMQVIGYDLYPDLNFAKENSFEYKTLDELLSLSDIVTLHAPYTKDNHHLLNRENMSLVKKGVHILNTARGELIDTDALIWALKQGIVAGAGLDVLEGERELKEEVEILSNKEKSDHVQDYKTLLEDRVLIDMPNVIVTPHIAFYSKEAISEILRTTVDNIKSFPSNPINVLK